MTIVILGDCVETMRRLASAGLRVDSIVTDPPYHLKSIVERFGAKDAAPAKFGADGAFARQSKGFMGQTWDGGDVAADPETWRQAYDVLKPGGYLLAFGGTRTFHRMTCAIEDAGFDIRDCLMWLYGQGFPKSHNVERAIATSLCQLPGRHYEKTLPPEDKRLPEDHICPSCLESEPWDGFGTALKPAWEPIIMARKPHPGTIAANVLEHGVGGINIEGCRVELPEDDWLQGGITGRDGRVVDTDATEGEWGFKAVDRPAGLGRWPANVIHDGSEVVVELFPRRFFYCAKATAKDRAGSKHPTVKPIALMRYLVRMVTPPGGVVLDPFAGSGTTLQAAIEEGFRALGIEKEEPYVRDIIRRLKYRPT